MKGRFWTTIVYPESCRVNWQDYLEERGLVFAVSPLHDKDIEEATGQPDIVDNILVRDHRIINGIDAIGQFFHVHFCAFQSFEFCHMKPPKLDPS